MDRTFSLKLDPTTGTPRDGRAAHATCAEPRTIGYHSTHDLAAVPAGKYGHQPSQAGGRPIGFQTVLGHRPTAPNALAAEGVGWPDDGGADHNWVIAPLPVPAIAAREGLPTRLAVTKCSLLGTLV
ncbi:MAG TPA: hypothetical protein VNS22_11965 [Geminicoccus sp.]|nr:hypothetical protein [Geminicoccus sp.]